MIQLIASDMDGTLLNDEMTISESNVAAIREAERMGVRFMVATGRGYSEAHPILLKAGLDGCPIIAMNGAQIYDKNGESIYTAGLSKDTVQKIMTFLDEHHLYYEIMTSKGVISNNKVKRIENIAALLTDLNPDTPYKMAVILASARLELMNIQYVDNYQEIMENEQVQILKMIAFHAEGQKILRPIADELISWGELAVTSSSINNIEINHIKAQKGIALERIAKDQGIAKENIMAIGDNFNDVSMLEYAGVSFVMENAEDEVKKIAKYTTSTNIENGVGEAIIRAIKENY